MGSSRRPRVLATENQPRRRQGRPPSIENARDRILDHAASLFAKQGFESSTLGDVALAIGVSKAGVYHYFSSKQEIYDAIIIRTLEGLIKAVEAEVSNVVQGERLRAFMCAHARYFESHYEDFVTMLIGFGGMRNAKFKRDAGMLRDRYEQFLRKVIEAEQADGALRPDADPVVTARAVLSMLNWMVRWFKPKQGSSAETFARQYHDLFVSGLSA